MAETKRPSGSSRPSPPWSTLPKELSELVLSRLDLGDHIRFSAVCKWWRFVAAIENPPTNKPFALVRSDHGFRLIDRLLSSFWPSWLWAWTLGSFQTWLVLHNGSPYLLNPSSPGSSIIPLPRLPSFPCPLFDTRINNTHKVILSSPPFSTADNCLVVVKDNRGRLASCRLGEDTDWTYFYDRKRICDILFCMDKLYGITAGGDLRIFDPANLDSKPTKLKFPSEFDSGHISGGFYLAPNASHDHKLFAIKKVREVWTAGYQVFEVDPKGRDSTSYVVAKSLGDDILFLSSFCSITLPAKDYPDFQRNSVYICLDPGNGSFDSLSLEDKNVVHVRPTGNCPPLFFSLFGALGLLPM